MHATYICTSIQARASQTSLLWVACVLSLGAFSLTSENSSPFITRGVSIKEENNVSTEAAVHVASPLSSTELSKLVL
ncbi:hypothetical protein IAS59_006024 [Cryptococcus gattii]